MADTGFTFGEMTSTTFTDWDGICDVGGGTLYESFLHTSYSAADDQMFYMQAPYIYCFLDNVDAGSQSLLMQAAWDWSNSNSSFHWSEQQEVYNFRANNEVSVSRRKIRGRGRVLQLRFTSAAGKDFSIFGWGMPIGKNMGS